MPVIYPSKMQPRIARGDFADLYDLNEGKDTINLVKEGKFIDQKVIDAMQPSNLNAENISEFDNIDAGRKVLYEELSPEQKFLESVVDNKEDENIGFFKRLFKKGK